MKRCPRCKEIKLPEAFCVDHSRPKGRGIVCKVCDANLKKEYYRKNAERIKKVTSAYAKTPKGKKIAIKKKLKQLELHPERSRAHMIVSNAIARGDIQRIPCIVCGDPKSEGHHQDYSKPLDVLWLCILHHRVIEKKSIYTQDQYNLVISRVEQLQRGKEE